jgi:hypothetical protein
VDGPAQLMIFVLAAAVMLLEVALTRVFSFITFHHMTYFVIGMGMLGFGAAGTYLSLRGPIADPSRARARLAGCSGMFAVTTLLAVFLIPKIPFYPVDMHGFGDVWRLLLLTPVIVFTALPFFFAGICIGHILGTAGALVNRLYFADLVGSALGSLLAILLINWLGALATSVVAAALALLAVALAGRRFRVASAGAIALAVVSPYAERPEVMTLAVPPGKQMYGYESSIELSTWHSITRLDVTFLGECPCSFGGALSQRYAGPAPIVRNIYQDASNLTGIIHPTPTPKQTPALGYYLQGAPYRIRPTAEALVIGSGGGVDVVIGLHHGAKHVVAVDVNPKTMDLVRNRYSEFAGGVFNGSDVEPVVSEGRHFLSRDHREFDVIQLSGVDTWAALSSGAIALTENFIYTAEAFDAYLAHLKPDGVLGFSRPHMDPPLEIMRLATTALAALERRGVRDAYRHLVVMSGHGQSSSTPWAELLVKRSAFTQAEVQVLTDWAAGLDFQVVFEPFVERGNPVDAVSRISPEERRRRVRAYEFNVSPATDDAPFYFQHHRWRDLFREPPLGYSPPTAMWVLAASLVQFILLSAFLILYPLRRLRPIATTTRGDRIGLFCYFGALGLGFIVVEIGLLSKLTIFLGGPAYALAITLSVLLGAAGLGSLLSGRLASQPLELLAKAIPAAIVLIVLHGLFLDAMTAKLLGLPLLGRAAASVLLIGPLGVLLGMAFPAGLRYLDAVGPELKPWAWGINACATVVGTSLSMILATAAGFGSAFVVGALTYGFGYAALRVSVRRSMLSAAAPT